jgi:hypothetical protein
MPSGRSARSASRPRSSSPSRHVPSNIRAIPNACKAFMALHDGEAENYNPWLEAAHRLPDPSSQRLRQQPVWTADPKATPRSARSASVPVPAGYRRPDQREGGRGASPTSSSSTMFANGLHRLGRRRGRDPRPKRQKRASIADGKVGRRPQIITGAGASSPPGRPAAVLTTIMPGCVAMARRHRRGRPAEEPSAGDQLNNTNWLGSWFMLPAAIFLLRVPGHIRWARASGWASPTPRSAARALHRPGELRIGWRMTACSGCRLQHRLYTARRDRR